MTGLTLPLLWAQAAGAGAGTGAQGPSGPGVVSPAATASLAFRRWCSGLTLCSPDVAPGPDALYALLISLGALAAVVLVLQGPSGMLRQLADVPGHLSLVYQGSRRVWRAGRLVAAAIAFTVLSWTGSQTFGFILDRTDRGKADLVLLTRSRTHLELALEQGLLAGLTPLRDVAALGDNLPLLICAVYLIFRMSSGMSPAVARGSGTPEIQFVGAYSGVRSSGSSGWATVLWGSGALYVLYRLVARASGSVELPLGGCLVAEALVIPLVMLLCDGFLLAWLLTEIRKAGCDGPGDDSRHASFILELMPAAALACFAALPARYVGTLVFLVYQHLPTTIGTTAVGSYIRWQFGWGLVDLQAASLIFLGLAGVVAWTRGSMRDAVTGFARLLREQGGRLIAAVAMAVAAATLLGGLIYPLILLLPPAGWVLPAADGYSHYLTLPVGLWTVAALVDLAQRSLPLARVAESEPLAPASVDGAVMSEAEPVSEPTG